MSFHRLQLLKEKTRRPQRRDSTSHDEQEEEGEEEGDLDDLFELDYELEEDSSLPRVNEINK